MELPLPIGCVFYSVVRWRLGGGGGGGFFLGGGGGGVGMRMVWGGGVGVRLESGGGVFGAGRTSMSGAMIMGGGALYEVVGVADVRCGGSVRCGGGVCGGGGVGGVVRWCAG